MVCVICSSCGRPFHAQRSTAKYCSNACKQDAYRQRNGLTSGLHPNDAHREAARRGAITLAARYFEVTCQHCGRVVGADGNTVKNLKYCSDACSQAAYRKRKKQA